MALSLEKHAGPLPVWGWAVVVAIGGYVLYRKLALGSGSTVANATSPGQNAQDGTGIGTGGFVPIYLSPSTDGSGATDSGGGSAASGGGDNSAISPGVWSTGPSAGGGASSGWGGASSAGGGGGGGPLNLGYYTGGEQRGVLKLVQDANGVIGSITQSGEYVGLKFLNPQAQWQIDANAAIARLLSHEPSTVPVGDLYGGIGYQTPEAARAGGYWGPGGNWIATATPWNPLPGKPPLGNLPPGTPYQTGTAQGLTPLPPPDTPAGTGGVVGTPVKYKNTAQQFLMSTLAGVH